MHNNQFKRNLFIREEFDIIQILEALFKFNVAAWSASALSRSSPYPNKAGSDRRQVSDMILLLSANICTHRPTSPCARRPLPLHLALKQSNLFAQLLIALFTSTRWAVDFKGIPLGFQFILFTFCSEIEAIFVLLCDQSTYSLTILS